MNISPPHIVGFLVRKLTLNGIGIPSPQEERDAPCWKQPSSDHRAGRAEREVWRHHAPKGKSPGGWGSARPGLSTCRCPSFHFSGNAGLRRHTNYTAPLQRAFPGAEKARSPGWGKIRLRHEASE
jgi:hypothetical protein